MEIITVEKRFTGVGQLMVGIKGEERFGTKYDLKNFKSVLNKM